MFKDGWEPGDMNPTLQAFLCLSAWFLFVIGIGLIAFL